MTLCKFCGKREKDPDFGGCYECAEQRAKRDEAAVPWKFGLELDERADEAHARHVFEWIQ